MTFIVRRTAGLNHYYVDLDVHERHRLPGVTSIVRAMANPRIENYGAGQVAEKAVNYWDDFSQMPPADRLNALKRGRWEQRDAAGRRGKEVHRLGEKLLIGEPVVVPEELKGYVDSYVAFMDLSDLNVHHVEVACYSVTHQYAGTTDIIGDLVLPDLPEWKDVPRDGNGRSDGILDPKTGRGVYESAALQLAAYRHSERLIIAGAASKDPEKRVEIDTPSVGFTAAVHIHPDGTPATLIRTDSSAEAFRWFTHLRQVYELQQIGEELLYPPTPYPPKPPAAEEPPPDDLASDLNGEF